jgi:protein-tyrosine phosphatase
MYKFSAASQSEPIVFGAAKPAGYSNENVAQWVEFMQREGIARVCCLLSAVQVKRYSALLKTYQAAFGHERVCWSPIEDFQLVSSDALMHKILLFLATADHHQEKTVVHCSGGVGRTGHVLAAWLVSGRGLSNQAAISAVRQMRRNPYEAVIVAPLMGRLPWVVVAELHALLDRCRQGKLLCR